MPTPRQTPGTNRMSTLVGISKPALQQQLINLSVERGKFHQLQNHAHSKHNPDYGEAFVPPYADEIDKIDKKMGILSRKIDALYPEIRINRQIEADIERKEFWFNKNDIIT